MKIANDKGHSIDTLFAILLFSILTLCALSIIVLGGKVYQNIAKNMDENFTSRTALSYISNKVKQHDKTDSVLVESRQGEEALILKEDIDGTIYETWIYYDNGSIKEIFTEEGTDIPLDTGTVILNAQDIHFKLTGSNLLHTEVISKDGGSMKLLLNLRSGG